MEEFRFFMVLPMGATVNMAAQLAFPQAGQIQTWDVSKNFQSFLSGGLCLHHRLHLLHRELHGAAEALAPSGFPPRAGKAEQFHHQSAGGDSDVGPTWCSKV